MTCYMRHMDDLFGALGLARDKDNRKRVDTALRVAMGLDPALPCGQVWATAKTLGEAERGDLVSRVARFLD